MAISLLLIEGFIPSWVLSLSITIIAILRAKLRIFGVKNARKNGDGGEVKSIKDFFLVMNPSLKVVGMYVSLSREVENTG